MSEFKDKIVFIAGGTGGVGEGIVRYFTKQQATVIVTSRSETKINRLKEYLGVHAHHLYPIFGDMTDEQDALRIRDEMINKFGKLDLVVASIGAWIQGRKLTEVSKQMWDQTMQNNLTSHFIIGKTFMPIVKRGGSYIFIVGLSAYQTYPGTGLVSIAGAAQLMLSKAFSADLKHEGIRIYDLVFGPINTRTRPMQYRSADYVSAEDIGQLSGLIMTYHEPLSNPTINVQDNESMQELLEALS